MRKLVKLLTCMISICMVSFFCFMEINGKADEFEYIGGETYFKAAENAKVSFGAKEKYLLGTDFEFSVGSIVYYNGGKYSLYGVYTSDEGVDDFGNEYCTYTFVYERTDRMFYEEKRIIAAETDGKCDMELSVETTEESANTFETDFDVSIGGGVDLKVVELSALYNSLHSWSNTHTTGTTINLKYSINDSKKVGTYSIYEQKEIKEFISFSIEPTVNIIGDYFAIGSWVWWDNRKTKLAGYVEPSNIVDLSIERMTINKSYNLLTAKPKC